MGLKCDSCYSACVAFMRTWVPSPWGRGEGGGREGRNKGRKKGERREEGGTLSYKPQYYLWFRASTGDLAIYSKKIREEDFV